MVHGSWDLVQCSCEPKSCFIVQGLGVLGEEFFSEDLGSHMNHEPKSDLVHNTEQ